MWERFSLPRSVLEMPECRMLARLAECTYSVLEDIQAREVELCSNGPLMTNYGCDDTPLRTRVRYNIKLDGVGKLQRTGTKPNDLLVQRQHLLWNDADGIPHVSVLIREPTPMSEGKDRWAHYSAYRVHSKSPRELGHKGIVLLVSNVDRALLSMGPLIKAHSDLQCKLHAASANEAVELLLLTWPVQVPCVLHDCSGAENGPCLTYCRIHF